MKNEKVIRVEDLRFSYPQGKEAVRGISFDVEKGEIFGFLGPSGAGKSTTQKILIGILKKFRGSVRVLGSDLNRISPDFYEQVGVSFEFPNLYEKFTARENLEFFASLYREETESPDRLLELLGLLESADMRVSGFSKGMKMRLNFCRALLNKPSLLFLDEPTSGLDPVNARKMKELILDARARGVTVFLTTHNMHDAAGLCDRVAFIVDGEISLIDSPKELMLKRSSKRLTVEYWENGGGSGARRKTEEFPFEGLGENKVFLRILKNGKIDSIHSQEATLEDIFVEVTGSTL